MCLLDLVGFLEGLNLFLLPLELLSGLLQLTLEVPDNLVKICHSKY